MSHAKKAGMSLVVRTIAGLLAPFIFLFGAGMVFYGDVTPGGGFAGGVVVACAFILLTLANGQREALRIASKNVAVCLATVGGLIFVGLAAVGACHSHGFFENPLRPSLEVAAGPGAVAVLRLYEIAIALVVSMSLYLVFSMLSAPRTAPGTDCDEPAPDEEDIS